MHLTKEVHRIKARSNPSTERGGGQDVPPFAEGFLATWLLGEGQLVLFKIVTPDRSATLQGSTWVNTNRILWVLKKEDLNLGGLEDEAGVGERWGRGVNRIKIDCMEFSKN